MLLIKRVKKFIFECLKPKTSIAGNSNLPPLYTIGNQEDQSHRYALVSYLTAPFTRSEAENRKIPFSNNGIAYNLVRVLRDMGYVVDVIKFTDQQFVPKREYSLFIGHSAYNFENIAKRLSDQAVKIFFATGIYWQDHNRLEKERFLRIENKYGIRLPYDRMYVHNEDAVCRMADGIICLGNNIAQDSYRRFSPVFALNNAAFDDDHFDRFPKDREVSRKGFLFFAGPGNVHKGLDLLLEAFDSADAELYVCQRIEEQFAKLYSRQLFNSPNIHTLGQISYGSQQFYELIAKCNFVIMPSCAEGSAGSVVACMHQGLIPVVTEACTISVDGFGVLLDASSVETIAATVRSLTQRPVAWVETMARRTREAAVANFSEDNFIENMRAAVEGIISKCPRRCESPALQAQGIDQ